MSVDKNPASAGVLFSDFLFFAGASPQSCYTAARSRIKQGQVMMQQDGSAPRGELIVVGTGISFGQMTEEAMAHIARADLVLSVVPNGVINDQLLRLNARLESMMPYYGDDRTRAQTYEAMTTRMVNEVKAGKQVCTVFYGHPGVFVTSSHQAIRRLRADGYRARMLPGVSADACLIADIGVDPSDNGWLSFEATSFLFAERVVDPTISMLLWQIGIAGECTLKLYEPGKNALTVIRDVLLTAFPPDHQVCLYEAASIPGFLPRIDWFALKDFPAQRTQSYSTLFIPAADLPDFAQARLAPLGMTEQELAVFDSL